MSEDCVLDASAALSVLVAGQTSSAARTFFLDPSREWRAPRLLHLEVRNAIHRLERRGTLAIGSADARLALLEGEIRFEDTNDAARLSRIVARAREASLSVYDATYLEMAQREGAALATRDAALLSAATLANVTVFDLR